MKVVLFLSAFVAFGGLLAHTGYAQSPSTQPTKPAGQSIGLRTKPALGPVPVGGPARKSGGSIGTGKQTETLTRCRRGGYGSINRPAAAFTAACIRLEAFSFSRALSMWKSTVRLVRPRIVAISDEVLPRAAQVNASASRSVRSTVRGQIPSGPHASAER